METSRLAYDPAVVSLGLWFSIEVGGGGGLGPSETDSNH